MEKNIEKKIELLSPAGSLANIKAAVVSGADSVYLGLEKFNARDSATNFNKDFLKKAITIAKSNNVKVYLTMNTLVKNHEIDEFFSTLTIGYLAGIDAVIIQDPAFINIIKENYPGLDIHLSTQTGIMNSSSANFFENVNRIILARELSYKNLEILRKNVKTELEIFVHGALCVSVSGACLFSSLLGGRSGNRGRCAQPCRKEYNNCFLLSTKELNLIEKIPELVNLGIDSIKIEGRLRSPSYVANITSAYKEAIKSYYSGNFLITEDMKKRLNSFSRGFTKGKYSGEFIFNRKKASLEKSNNNEVYEPSLKTVIIKRKKPSLKLPKVQEKKALKKQLLVSVYSIKDAISAEINGADIVYLDMFNKDFNKAKETLKIPLFAKTPRIMFDSDIPLIIKTLKNISPSGILAGDLGMINILKSIKLNIPIHLDYNKNTFNDLDLIYLEKRNIFPIISPELSMDELKKFKNKNFAVFVHGRIILMNLAHKLIEGKIKDKKGFEFLVKNSFNGVSILNSKELGLFNKTKNLTRAGIHTLYIDCEYDIANIVSIYRKILDGKTVDVSNIKKNYVLGWSSEGIL